MKNSLERLTNSLLPIVGGSALFIMMAVTIIDIVMRSTLGKPVQGAYEIVQFSLVTTVYAGLGETFRRGSHVLVDLIDSYLPNLATRVLKPLESLLSIAVVLTLLWGAVLLASETLHYHEVTTDLGIPVFWMWLPVIVGLAWSAICILLNAIYKFDEV